VAVRFAEGSISSGAALEFVQQHAGQLRQFAQGAQQGVGLSTTDDTRMFRELPGGHRVSFLDQFGMQTLFIEPAVPPVTPLTPPAQAEPVIDEAARAVVSSLPSFFVGLRIKSQTGDDQNYWTTLNPLLFQQVGTSEPAYPGLESVLSAMPLNVTGFQTSRVPETFVKSLVRMDASGRVWHMLPLEIGRGVLLTQDLPGPPGPAEGVVWDYAFIWDPLSAVWVQALSEILTSGEAAASGANIAPRFPLGVKVGFFQSICAKGSAVVEYVSYVGALDRRVVNRGEFTIRAGSSLDFQSYPGGGGIGLTYPDGTPVPRQHPQRPGGCKPDVYDRGPNPHDSNWWDGMLVAHCPPELYNLPPEQVPFPSVSEVYGDKAIPLNAFEPGTREFEPNYTLMCTPCPWKNLVVFYAGGSVGTVDGGIYNADTSDLYSADPCNFFPGNVNQRKVLYRYYFNFDRSSFPTPASLVQAAVTTKNQFAIFRQYTELTVADMIAMLPDSIPIMIPVAYTGAAAPFGIERGEWAEQSYPMRDAYLGWYGGIPVAYPRYQLVETPDKVCGVGIAATEGIMSVPTVPNISIPQALEFAPPRMYNDTFLTSNWPVDTELDSATALDHPSSGLRPRGSAYVGFKFDFVTREFRAFKSDAEMAADFQTYQQGDPDVYATYV
jgi:hypothetical protein